MDSIGASASSELVLRDYARIIWRRKWIIVVAVILLTAGSQLITRFFVTPKYQSSTEILQRQSGIDKVLFGSELFQRLSNPERNIQTAAELVLSPEVTQAVNKKLANRLSGADAALFIKVSPVEKADMLEITAIHSDPALAADVANIFAEEYIAWRQKVDRDVVRQATEPIQDQLATFSSDQQESASYKVLKDKLETLKLIEAMQIGNLEVVKTASIPSAPASPQPLRTGLIALLIGLFSGVGMVLALDQFDTKVRSTDEVVDRIKKPVLATIPVFLNKNGSIATLSQPTGPCSEAYRLLKTNLGYTEPDRVIKSILVTSPEPGDGKSTTVANLAVTMARAGKKVIVLEADWRRPTLAKYFNLPEAAGVTNALSGNCSLPDILQTIEADRMIISASKKIGEKNVVLADGGIHSLDGTKPIYFATAGPIPPNPGELAASEKLGTLIMEAGSYADIVLVDAPPLGVVGDAASIASKVDGVVFVVKLAKTAKRSLGMMQSFMDTVPATILGLVITDFNTAGTYYRNYGGYYYQEYGKQS